MIDKIKTCFLGHLIVGLSLFAALPLKSCNEETSVALVEIDIRYRNASTKAITITHYARPGRSINSEVPQIIELNSGETKSFYNVITESGSEDNSQNDFDDFILKNRLYDSAYLNFQDERYIGFSKGIKNTEIFQIENYTGLEVSDNTFEFTYEFTEEDFENADEIGS